jgi:hypothetical protein
MIIVGIGVAIITTAAAAVYFAVRSRDVRKFLAGAFFVSGGIQFYLYLAKVSVPLLGTSFVFTPEISRVRSILHFVFFCITFYFGFLWKRKGSSGPDRVKNQ